MRGFIIGALTLIALEVLVTSKNGPAAVGGAFGVLGRGAQLFMDPTVPAFKPKTATAPAATAPAAGTAAGSASLLPLLLPANNAPNPAAPPPTNPAGTGTGTITA